MVEAMTDAPIEPLIGNLIDSLGGAQLSDPWVTIAQHRKSRHTVLIADLDLDIPDVPQVTETVDIEPKNPNPARDLMFYSAHLVDQVASQVLMFRTCIDTWMLHGPAGIHTLTNLSKRMTQLGTPTILELHVGGSARNVERQLSTLFGHDVPGGHVGFRWMTPAWVQVPSCAPPAAVRRLLGAGKGVFLDLAWETGATAAGLLVRVMCASPLAPRPSSGVMPVGFSCPGDWFLEVTEHSRHDIAKLRTAVPFLVETSDQLVARRALARGVEINCPVIVSMGRSWANAWRTHPEGATKWRRIALDHVLALNTALEEPL